MTDQLPLNKLLISCLIKNRSVIEWLMWMVDDNNVIVTQTQVDFMKIDVSVSLHVQQHYFELRQLFVRFAMTM